MAEHVCEQCGASNARAAQFCHACDAYLGWDKGATTIGGQPVLGAVPHVLETVATEAPVTPPRRSPTRAPARETPSDVELPRVRLGATAVTLTPGSPVTVPLELFNASDIVDGFVVEPAQAPGWLEASHAAVRLMPQQEGALELTVATRADVLVLAQRFALRLHVSSEADPAKVTEVRLAVTVPAVGPPATLDVRPRLLRLTDATRATFAVVVDNRAANFPQTFHLAGSDPEGVVRLGFLPPVVQAPAGQAVEVRGHLVAPAPPPGREANRPLTITGSNDEGVVTATLALLQHTSAEPQDVPVTMRLSPRELRLTDAVVAEFEVHVDNRGGHREVVLALDGRDPAHLLTVSLSPQRLVVPAGGVALARGRVRTSPVPRGSTVSRPFTVVATDGVTDVEAPGLLEVSATPAPLTTAEVRVTPRHLRRADSRRGTFTVEIDNVRGREQLAVRLTGADDHGVARFAFEPAALTVAPGQVARARMTVECPRPPRGESRTRELRVTAGDGEGRLEAAASLTQVSADRGPLLRTLLVLCGAVLVVLGALLPWLLAFGDGGLSLVERAVQLGEAVGNELLIAAAGVRVLLGLLALAMVLGLSGSGSLVRKAALLAVVLSVGYVVAATSLGAPFTVSPGLAAVWLGAVLAYVGGVLARRE